MIRSIQLEPCQQLAGGYKNCDLSGLTIPHIYVYMRTNVYIVFISVWIKRNIQYIQTHATNPK